MPTGYSTSVRLNLHSARSRHIKPRRSTDRSDKIVSRSDAPAQGESPITRFDSAQRTQMRDRRADEESSLAHLLEGANDAEGLERRLEGDQHAVVRMAKPSRSPARGAASQRPLARFGFFVNSAFHFEVALRMVSASCSTVTPFTWHQHHPNVEWCLQPGCLNALPTSTPIPIAAA